MGTPLFKIIELSMNKFSKGQRKIAEFIVTEYDKAAFMTAAKLGKTVGVSESTVVRFASEIGFEGYPQLQRAMQEIISNRLTSIQRIELIKNRIGDEHILKGIMSLDIEKIRKTIDEVSTDEFDNVVDSLCESADIYILGTRSASALAAFFGYYMSLIFDNVKIVDPSNESAIFEQMLRISEKDAVVAISFPRYSSKVVKAMRFASDRNAKTIALTDSMSSPLIPYASYKLLAKSDMVSFVDSFVAPLSIINALIVAAAFKKKEEVEQIFTHLEAVWAEYGVYDSNEIAPAEGHSAEGKPTEGKPEEGIPASDNPTEEKPAEGIPTSDKPARSNADDE